MRLEMQRENTLIITDLKIISWKAFRIFFNWNFQLVLNHQQLWIGFIDVEDFYGEMMLDLNASDDDLEQ